MLDTTPDRVSEKARWAPRTSLLRRLTSAPVRVRMKNATGMVWTWSNTARRRSRIRPSPMRADQSRVATLLTASAMPIAAMARASRMTIRGAEPSTIAVTTRPASRGVATARTAPRTESTRKRTIRPVCGRAKIPIRRMFSRVKTLRSSRVFALSDRIIARMAACCIVTSRRSSPGPRTPPARSPCRVGGRFRRPVGSNPADGGPIPAGRTYSGGPRRRRAAPQPGCASLLSRKGSTAARQHDYVGAQPVGAEPRARGLGASTDARVDAPGQIRRLCLDTVPVFV